MGSAGSFFIETFLVGGGEVVRDACKKLESKEVHGSISSGPFNVCFHWSKFNSSSNLSPAL